MTKLKCPNCGHNVLHIPYHPPVYGRTRCPNCGYIIDTFYNPATGYKKTKAYQRYVYVKKHLGRFYDGWTCDIPPGEKISKGYIPLPDDWICVSYAKGKTFEEKLVNYIVSEIYYELKNFNYSLFNKLFYTKITYGKIEIYRKVPFNKIKSVIEPLFNKLLEKYPELKEVPKLKQQVLFKFETLSYKKGGK